MSVIAEHPYIIDIILVLVLVISWIIGAHRGFLKSLMGIAVLGVSLAGASWSAAHLTQPVVDWLKPTVLQRVIDQFLPQGGSLSGVTMRSVPSSALSSKLQDMLDTAQVTAQTAVTDAVTSVLTQVVHASVFVVAFLVLLAVLWLITRPLEAASKLPAIHSIDAVGGGILGLLLGVLLVFILTWVCRRFGWLTAELVSQTYITRYFTGSGFMELITALR